MVFWQVRVNVQSINGLVCVILASIQSISGLYMYANKFCHNPSVDCAQTIFPYVEMSICNPLMDCALSFFCQIRGKNTPLNSNDLNLFIPLFSHFLLHLHSHQLCNF